MPHATYIIVCFVSTPTENNNKSFLRKYKNKNNKRKKFATDLGLALMNWAIKNAWKPGPDGKYHCKDKTKWMPQTIKNGKYHPCDCGKCFFCMNKITCGIAHGKASGRPKVQECSMEREKMKGSKIA